MLEELNVKNFALIDDITVSFSEGFNVLSGERFYLPSIEVSVSYS